METVYTERHRLRNAKSELFGGELVEPFERPERMDTILARLQSRKLGRIIKPREFGLAPVLRVHDPDYAAFLRNCWIDWTAAGHAGEALPTTWPSRRMNRLVPPRDIEGRIGYYCLAGETSITDGTWEAALASAAVALTGAALLQEGAGAAFALCRPPGHHAATDMFGGYCFLNNAAIATQSLRDDGAARVAVLDIDFHHGNGTQQIFYERPDVYFASIHGDPMDAFPYFLGGADETGEGDGEGANANYPLPPGTGYPAWADALADALLRIRSFRPDSLVVSLGVDAYKADPISFFGLESDDFLRAGEAIGALRLPTLFVMEGGYALKEIGINAVNVLEGFESA